MTAKIKKALGWWVGNDFYHRWLLGMGTFIIGVLIAKHVEFAIRGPTIKEIVWNDAFSGVPAWVGYYFIVVSIDLILFRTMAHWVICRYLIWPPLRLALTRALGPARMAKLIAFLRATDDKAKETTG